MRQYRNEVNGLSLMERAVMRKSGTLSINPKCCGITTKSYNHRPTNTEPVSTIGSHQTPSHSQPGDVQGDGEPRETHRLAFDVRARREQGPGPLAGEDAGELRPVTPRGQSQRGNGQVAEAGEVEGQLLNDQPQPDIQQLGVHYDARIGVKAGQLAVALRVEGVAMMVDVAQIVLVGIPERQQAEDALEEAVEPSGAEHRAVAELVIGDEREGSDRAVAPQRHSKRQPHRLREEIGGERTRSGDQAEVAHGLKRPAQVAAPHQAPQRRRVDGGAVPLDPQVLPNLLERRELSGAHRRRGCLLTHRGEFLLVDSG